MEQLGEEKNSEYNVDAASTNQPKSKGMLKAAVAEHGAHKPRGRQAGVRPNKKLRNRWLASQRESRAAYDKHLKRGGVDYNAADRQRKLQERAKQAEIAGQGYEILSADKRKRRESKPWPGQRTKSPSQT